MQQATSKFTHGLGERIRFVRRRADLSQEVLGLNLDVTRQSISGYETERLVPSSRVIEKICDHYRVNPWWLLYGVGSYSPDTNDITTEQSVAHLSAPGEQLTHAQRALIEYIKADKEAAQSLARLLWDKALKI